MKKYTAKYELKDIVCEYCADRKITKYGTCGYRLCPYIMDNLPDLLSDDNFLEAVKNADNCTTNHKTTLKYLKKRWDERTVTCNDIDDTAQICDFKPECVGCKYPSHGFMCHSNTNLSCLKSWRKFI